MIGEIGTDLLNRVRSVPSLASSTSFAIGGKATDPALKTIPLPACRLLFMNMYADEDPRSTGSSRGGGMVPADQVVIFDFRALLIVPYLDDTDILTVEFPLLNAVVDAIKDTSVPTASGHRWRLLSQKLSFVYPDRLGFEQRYTIDAVL